MCVSRLQMSTVLAAGLANEKTVHVEAGEDGTIAVTRTIPKNFNKPKDSRSKVTKKNKNFRRTAARLGKEVHTVRPDLKVRRPMLLTVICIMAQHAWSSLQASLARVNAEHLAS